MLNNVGEYSAQLIQLFREEALDLLDQWEKSCLSLQSRPEKPAWDQLFASVHSIKGSVQTLGFHHFPGYLSTIEDYLSKQTADTILNEHLQALLTAHTCVTAWVTSIESVDDDEIAEAIETIKRSLSTVTTNPSNNISLATNKKTNRERQREITPSPEPIKLDVSEDVRVSGKLIDRFLDQLGEIQTHHNILENHFLVGDVSASLANQSLSLSQTRIRELRRQVMELRSINAEVIFKRLKRTAVEANLALGKNVQLEFKGQLIKLEKSIADQIAAPLIHIVKNCVDHGIEGSEERVKSEKDENGTIHIALRRNVKNIEITLEDDGCGIDPESVLKKALNMGIIKSLPANVSDEFLLQVICTPGFSTSATVNEVSGRGVGMNAVAEKINSIGGTLSLTNKKGAGTKFTINVPNSFTSVKAIVVKINDYKIAIPINEISEVCQFKKNEIEFSLGEMKLEHKNDIIEYISLAKMLSVDPQRYAVTEDVFGLISGKGHLKSVYGVDSIVGQQEVVIRPLEACLTRLPGCLGAAYFSDGSPGLVISINKLKQNEMSGWYH